MNKRLTKEDYTKDILDLAPHIIGKLLVRRYNDGRVKKYRINEIEIYNGEEDTACHARIGKTPRTKTLYKEGGITYIYLCYGIHYLLNIVTGKKDHPEAILIRGVEGLSGPGKVSKELKITKELHEKDLTTSNYLWLEDDSYQAKFIRDKRIGIDYATKKYREIKWRYILKEGNKNE